LTLPVVAAATKYLCRRSLNFGRLLTTASDIKMVLTKAMVRLISGLVKKLVIFLLPESWL